MLAKGGPGWGVLAVVLASLAAPASAAAATTIGSDLSAVPVANFMGNTQATNVVQPSGSSTPSSSPHDGVLVRIRLRHDATVAAPGRYAYRILTGTPPNYTARPATPDGADERIPFPPTTAARISTFIPTDADGRPTGVPIAAGERLAIWNETAGAPAYSVPGTVGGLNFFGGDHVSGGPQPYSTAGFHALLQGVVEPDADGDRYGDETQDDCPTDATRQGPCATAPTEPEPTPEPPPDACPANDQRLDDCTAPVAQITGRPPAKTKKRKAAFEFTADEPASFECALDKGGFLPCRSPAGFKRLARKSHTFRLRATDANGNVSAPVTETWRVTKKK